MPDARIIELMAAGAGILKVKLGYPGDETDMVAGDYRSLQRLTPLIRGARTPLTDSGDVLFYLEANGRYRSKLPYAESWTKPTGSVCWSGSLCSRSPLRRTWSKPLVLSAFLSPRTRACTIRPTWLFEVRLDMGQ